MLILSAATGNGHMSAAKALGKAMAAQGIHAPVVDVLDHCPLAFRLWFAGGYETLVRKWPAMWGALYHGADRPGFCYAVQTMLDDRFTYRLKTLIDRERPDWVVCTHSLPQPRLERLRARGRRFRMAVVVTDLHPHVMWLRGRPDRFFAPEPCTQAALELRLPGSGAITDVTGIPIDASFVSPPDRTGARRQLGMDPDLPAVLVTSGGIGAGPVGEVLRALSRLTTPCQVTMACGRNAWAMRQANLAVDGAPAGTPTRFRVEGILPQEDFALRVRAADLVVGKPGGLTMTECLACGSPLLIYSPLLIPGQEEGNAAFMVNLGAGIEVGDGEALRSATDRLLACPERLAAMQRAALAAARPHAAAEITRILCEL